MQALLLSFLLSGPVHAVGWSELAGVFPPLPCQDGWAGCMVDGIALNADLRPDSQGVPMPADLRIDWFTLEGAPVLSPFAPLSSYPERMAEAPPPPEPEEPYEASRREEEVAAFHPEPAQAAGPGEHGSTSGSSTAQGRVPVSTTSGTGQAIPVPTTGGGGMRPGFSPTGSLPSQGAPAGSTPTTPGSPSSSAVAAAVAPATCSDLVALEPSALMGQLSGGQRSCLEDRLAAAGRQTEKDKVSRVLLTDAEARGDKTTWARLMKRHLEEIDRSDPDLCFKYAIYLSRLDVGRANGVIRWADYALENKANWKGATYISRVLALLKLKAEAANRIWQAAEEAYVESRTEENEAKATKYRNTTKAYAREWLDYARVSGQDTKNAMALCVSAAGNRQFCEGK